MKKTVYIAGPISTQPIQVAQKKFHDAQQFLKQVYQHVLNPLNNNLPENATWEEHMAEDLEMLRRAHDVYFLKGWKQSKGATLEHAVAKRLNKNIIYQPE